MSDVRKSVALRCFLWAAAVVLIAPVVWITDASIDMLPIWHFSQGKNHFIIECGVFWMVVTRTIWRWLSRRVWIGSLPSTERS